MKLDRKSLIVKRYPERILQFGEGNFLRCFVDWQIDVLNEKNGLDAGIVIARPIDTDFPPSLNMQDGLYTSIIRGYDSAGILRNEKRLISSVNREISVYREFDEFLKIASNPELRFVFSNTTEAGIAFVAGDSLEDAPPSSYPAKLTRFLYERYELLGGCSSPGLIILPCELIDYNGRALKEIVLRYAGLWGLEEGFTRWLDEENTFCSTLVDRIVTGFPKDEMEELEAELGYRDEFVTTGEFFHLFVIQGPPALADELKIEGSGLDIRIVEDLAPYKLRKVGILNGCHTAMVPVAWLCGIESVKDAVEDLQIEGFLIKLLEEEIIPNIGLPEDYLREYAETVLGRFRNPFIRHQLLSISLNSMTKYRTRILPQFLSYIDRNASVPPLMSLALAALICFYRGCLDGKEYPVNDDRHFLDLYSEIWKKEPETLEDAGRIADRVLGLSEHWGADLLSIEGLRAKIASDILKICSRGMAETLAEYL